ncbi:MAG: single-stranded-DNA-specific exonuclease RecJ [Clostridiales bacterium]|nr:single-stranded-DNA-specific exonuclease RecJ [Clostridiales bacterium]
MKKWIVSHLDKDNANMLANACSLPLMTAMLLSLRGINKRDDAINYLSDEHVVQSPFDFADMDKAVERITSAIDNFEKICVYGDYDADGITSTAVMYSYLSAMGANVIFMIPHRQEDGYGLNLGVIDKMYELGVTLIITVDNGITAHREIDYALQKGIDTVVTDHHTPIETLPNAVAVVDPHRIDCQSKFKFYSGVGVAFKVICALEGKDCDIYSLLDNYADLVAVGTIGDIVELSDENRFLVKYGLNALSNTERQGIVAMLNEAGIKPDNISASDVAYGIVPRINAMGRLGDTTDIVGFLLSDDEEYTAELAERIGKNNKSRQQLEQEIFSSAVSIIESDPVIKHRNLIIVCGDDWHVGVIGIVAARLKEIYGKPVIVISKNGDSAQGSCRSIDGFAICDALFYCSDLLEHCGGHPMAAGFGLKCENIGKFIEKIEAYADEFDMPYPFLDIDIKLRPEILGIELVDNISMLEPFGAGNPEPLFGIYNSIIESITPIGGGKHIRLGLKRDNVRFTAVKFSQTVEQFNYLTGDKVDLAVNLGINEYNNNKYLSVIIRDIKASDFDTDSALYTYRLYDRLCAGHTLTAQELQELAPSRNDFALLYRFLKTCPREQYTIDGICSLMKLDAKNCGKIAVMLDAMCQTGLIDTKITADKYNIKINEVSKKVDLNTAPIIMRINEKLQGR